MFCQCHSGDIRCDKVHACRNKYRGGVVLTVVSAPGEQADSTVALRKSQGRLAGSIRQRQQLAVQESSDGHELLGMAETEPRWNAEDIDVARWLPARIVEDNEYVPIEHRSRMYEATRISRIRQQKYFDIEGDSVVYDFGEAFVGLVRVTLRDAVKGQNMRIGNIRYVCSGEADEQAIQRFTTTDCRRLLISGDENFDNAQIQKVEALETETYTRDMKE